MLNRKYDGHKMGNKPIRCVNTRPSFYLCINFSIHPVYFEKNTSAQFCQFRVCSVHNANIYKWFYPIGYCIIKIFIDLFELYYSITHALIWHTHLIILSFGHLRLRIKKQSFSNLKWGTSILGHISKILHFRYGFIQP